MKVLVTFAVEAEFAPWRRLRELQPIKIGKITVYQAQIGRADVDFVITGMGMQNARRVAEVLLSQPYEFCITAGFAGALSEQHLRGDILVAEAIQELGNPRTLVCNQNLAYAARDNGAKLVKTFLTCNEVASTAAEKRRLASLADAVEMESFAIVAAAQQHHTPTVAIRVISDSSRQDMPTGVGTMVNARGEVSVGRVVRYITRHPLQLPALIRLGRDSKAAAESLARFLDTFLRTFSLSSHGEPPTEMQQVAAG
jgi:adenosylhomocysteine nucleosidase